MAEEPRGFNPGYVNPAEPGTDPIPVGDQAPTPTHGVPPESLPPPIKGGVAVTVSYDGRSYVIDIDTSDLYATPKPGSVTWDTLDQEIEDMIRDFSWNSLTDVPATFPSSPHHHQWSDIDDAPLEYPPAPHTHTVDEITDFPTSWDWSAIANKPTTYPPSAHTHTVSQITDFPDTWAWTDLTDVPSVFPPEDHTHPISEVVDLQAELDLKLEDAPVDGFTYGRKNGAWEKAAGAAQIADAAPATGDVGTFWFSSLTGQLAIRYSDDGGPVWVGLNGSLSTAVMISDTPPTSAYHGLLWWDSDSGELSIRYNDGDTEQWVSAMGGGPSGGVIEAGNNHIIYQAPNDPNLRIMEQWGYSTAADQATTSFPKPFKTTPVVTVTPANSIPTTAALMFNVDSATTTGFICQKRYLTWAAGGTTGYNAGVATQFFNWRAIGVAP